MTLNGVGSRTRLGLPAGGPRLASSPCPERTHRPHAAPQPCTGRPLSARGARDRRVRHDPRVSRRGPWAALRTMPPALLLRLLLAVSAAAASEPGTALAPATGDATLAIVFDVTGSMWDDLVQVMDGASRILERSLSHRSRAIANYALVPFHDPGSVPTGALSRPRKRPPRPRPRPVAALNRPPATARAHLEAQRCAEAGGRLLSTGAAPPGTWGRPPTAPSFPGSRRPRSRAAVRLARSGD